MRRDYWLWSVIAVTFLSRLVFFFSWHEVWWDAGVYLGMGKFLFSFGQSGLWEHIRPPLLPVFLGFFWWLGLSPVFFGRLLELFFMTGSVFLIYRVAEFWFDRRTALISSLLLCFSPIVFYLSFHLYTEIPAVFFILLSFYLFQRSRFFLSGASMSLAFLVKFPAAIFAPVLAVFLLRRWRDLLKFCSGFAVPAAPYFLLSWVIYGSPFTTLLAARDAIQRALGCNVLRFRPWYFYFVTLVTSEIVFNVFSLVGLFAVFRGRLRPRFIILLSLVLPLLYFIQLHCRDYRYLVLFYPFVALLAGFGFSWSTRFLNRKMFAVVAIILCVWFAFVGVKFYVNNEAAPVPVAGSFFSYLEDRSVEGEVWVSNPVVAAHSDVLLHKTYYPIYDGGVSKQFVDYVRDNSGRISFVMLDNCGGGLICAEDDPVCLSNTEQLYSVLDKNFSLVFNESYGRCWYKVWSI